MILVSGCESKDLLLRDTSNNGKFLTEWAVAVTRKSRNPAECIALVWRPSLGVPAREMRASVGHEARLRGFVRRGLRFHRSSPAKIYVGGGQ